MLNTTLPLPPRHDRNFWPKGASSDFSASAASNAAVSTAGSGSLDTASIVGFVLGSISGAVILGALVLLGWRCYRGRRRSEYIPQS